MKKINRYDDFNKIDEEFDFSKESFKNLINKVKSIIPKDRINAFIKDNRAEVERVRDLITNDDGDIDYSKAITFAKKAGK